MITRSTGNLFASEAHALACPVNCVGVAGKGLAKAFKARFPGWHRWYRASCDTRVLRPGTVLAYDRWQQVVTCTDQSRRWILSFPTKRHYRDQSRIEDIDDGLAYLADHFEEWGIESLAVPALGCGLGGLEWRKIKSLIIGHLGPLGIPVEIYEPR